MKWVSYVAEGWRSALLVIAGVIVLWWRLGKQEAVLTLAAGLSSLLDPVLKFVINRPRPTPDLVHILVVVSDRGFPSGHAFFSIVFLGLLAYFAFAHLSKLGLRMLIVVSLTVLIVLIGASRVYLGVHWPSDVLGGYIIGAVFLGILIWLDRILKRSRYENKTNH
jgi:undecaprenyl-diphosphatase